MSESNRRLVSYMEPTSWALASTAQTMTVWMTLLVTVERAVPPHGESVAAAGDRGPVRGRLSAVEGR